MAVDKLRELTRTILVKDEQNKPVQSTLVRVEKQPKDTVYSLVTSISDVKYLSQTLLDGFAKDHSANLVTYRVKVLKEKPVKSSSYNQRESSRVVRFVAYQAETPQDQTALPPPSEPAPATTPTSAEASAATDQEAVGVPTNPDEAVGVPVTQTTELILEFSGSNDDSPEIDRADKGAKIDGPTLRDQLITSATAVGVELNPILVEVAPEPLPLDWRSDDVSGFSTWTVKLPTDEKSANAIVSHLTTELQRQPKWLSLSQIGTRVAGEMQQRAIGAVLLSLVFIVAYIWFRFQKVAYGLAAVIALVHDVIITLGILALCHWLSGPLSFLLVEDFKIGLTEVAAFLTIIGYSLNDTIVVFDRIREVRGRSPKLTAPMINDSVNQTLSRTLLTSGTTIMTIIVLYVFGGEGIHAFAFALLVGVTVGTYSSIFIAAPVLLWLSNRETSNQQRPGSIG